VTSSGHSSSEANVPDDKRGQRGRAGPTEAEVISIFTQIYYKASVKATIE